MKKLLSLLLMLLPFVVSAQSLAPLTVAKIMRDPKWIGTSPSQPFWSPNGQKLYFYWNPQKAISDSLYFITLNNLHPQKVAVTKQRLIKGEQKGSFNLNHSQFVFVQKYQLRLLDVASGQIRTLLKQSNTIKNPRFGFHGKQVVYQSHHNLFAYQLKSGKITQITNFKAKEKDEEKDNKNSGQAAFLEWDALHNSSYLRRKKKEKAVAKRNKNALPKLNFPKVVYLNHKTLGNLQISPNGRFVTYLFIQKPKDARHTIVPDYVTKSGYIKDISGRTNVGVPQAKTWFYVFDRKRDTTYEVSTEQIPGIRDIPKFEKNYPKKYDSLEKHSPLRAVVVNGVFWNKQGTKAFVVIRALDHKDRWIMLLNAATGQLKLLDRQHDDAWIGGPDIGYTYQAGKVGWINDHTIWYQSEKTGYSHLYSQDINSGKVIALTSGQYEVQMAELSRNHKTFYITTNEVEPGETQYYKLNIKTKQQTRITHKKGGNKVFLSPDGSHLAVLFSTLTHPWELYLKENKAKDSLKRVTHKAESKAYQSYSWRTPMLFTFEDRDGYQVYAQAYIPKHPAATHPGVVFVHGAGYLQDVKLSWSYYFREHMFMNMLCDRGYTVIDIDYRGSAGYGRDWRTAIYRHMGGNDLKDIVDGTQYMIDSFGVNPDKVGIWGGSYGGFMTLMAMFKTDMFVCGAALRSVTDWAHYNHGYTSEILNLPQNDSIAYVRSSPIYFAKGLQGDLLMCHGMVDINVHYQDIVRLEQKLIELKKNNWYLASYPLESHAFTEPESWRDEYYRIWQLFEKDLIPKPHTK